MIYPSGSWRGFWYQEQHGRQEMRAFELHFSETQITGHGVDLVGPFTFAGQVDPANGQIVMVKQYMGKHSVRYIGGPDGEGSIHGQWIIDTRIHGEFIREEGNFLIQPVLTPEADEPFIRLDAK
ncbi:MAG: hypothetical protein ACRC8S_16080 [Fimbriiglobus sp.]